MKAEVLVHTLATTHAEVKSKKLENILFNVEAASSTQ